MGFADDVAPGLSGLAQLQALIKMKRRAGIGDGFAVFSGTPGEHAYNPLGTVHGGYASTLLDSACGCAVHTKMTNEQVYTTLELKVSFHKALNKNSGEVKAEGKVISIGRRAAFAEARLVGADGQLFASATSTCLIMDREKK